MASTTTTGPALPAPPPRNYQEKWTKMTAVTSITDFYKTFPTDGSISSSEMMEAYLQNDNDTFPVGLWCLIRTPIFQYRILTLHHIKKAPAVIGKGGHLSGKTIGVQNDVHKTGIMSMRMLSDGDAVFDLIKQVDVPTTTAVPIQYASAGNVGNDLLKPITTPADIQKVDVHKCCPVPLELLQLSVNKLYSPKELYDKTLKLTNDKKLPPADQPYLTWLRASMLLVDDGSGGHKSPVTKLGELELKLPALTVGVEEEEAYLQSQMQTDLHGRFRDDDQKDSILATALKDIHSNSVQTAVESKARAKEQELKQQKTWEKHSFFVKEKLSLLLKQADESQYPEAYNFVIQSKESKWHARAQESLSNEARQMNATFPPVIGKELTSILFSGDWATNDYEPEQYDKAITLFSMISPDSSLGKKIIKRNKDYDAAADHKTAPTAAEDRETCTEEVHLIRTLDDLDQTISMMNVFLSTFGENQHAKAFRDFVDRKWNNLFRRLRSPERWIPRTVRHPYLLLACYISHMMNRYYDALLRGENPDLPDYGSVEVVVKDKMWSQITDKIPDRYYDMLPGDQSTAATEGTTRTGGRASAQPLGGTLVVPNRDDVSELGTRMTGATSGGGRPAPGPQAGTGAAERSRGTRNNGPVKNESLNQEWHRRWKDDGRTISTMNAAGLAPNCTIDGESCPVCLGYNMMGNIFFLYGFSLLSTNVVQVAVMTKLSL